MSKFDHKNNWFFKFNNEDFRASYSFINDLDTEETLISCIVTCTDSSSVDTSSTMIDTVSVSSPEVYFNIKGGEVDNSYQIKFVGISSGGSDFTHYLTLDVYGSITLNANLGDSDANSYVTLKEANRYIRNVRGHSSTWDTLSIEGKKRVLLEACKDLNRFNFINPPFYGNQALPFPNDDHDTITGNCATPLTINSFKNTNFTSDTYGNNKSNTNYWEYGTVHITSATPLHDIRAITTSNVTTDVVTMVEDFSATPTINTKFVAFEPLTKNVKHAQIIQALYILENEGNDSLFTYTSMGANSVKIGDVSVTFKNGAASSRIPMSSEAKKLMSRYFRRHVLVGRA